ncbi:MAG: periplasmic solute binding protein [Firmicutes bacterium]|nr:periplasmic solute binding protein [Bacillota bacterium]
MFFSGCAANTVDNGTGDSDKDIQAQEQVKLDIVATDRILYYMVKDIVGEKHNVDYMFNNMDSLLYFKFTDDSLYNIAKMDLFIYMGASYEPWGASFADQINKSNVGIINASRGVNVLPLSSEAAYNEYVVRENPYYLLNYDNYKIALLNIKNSIQDKDPKNRDIYEQNFNEAINRTELEQKNIIETIAKLSDYTFVYSEERLEYLVNYYSLNSIKVMADGDYSDALKNKTKIVFLYSDSNSLSLYQGLINQYDMGTLELRVYSNDMKYEDMLLVNEGLLEAYYNSVNIKQ